ncbi:MAG: hypothetical protein F6J93_28185 [Oscillatoria sp. SIO1A7]|nr:hypothetical protein [Oscillatoria sp. SIO1A7]
MLRCPMPDARCPSTWRGFAPGRVPRAMPQRAGNAIRQASARTVTVKGTGTLLLRKSLGGDRGESPQSTI